jgi:hypothetical protein
MQIPSNIAKRTTIVVPDATAVLEGQVWSNLGAPLSSTGALGTDNYGVGVAIVDVPARATYGPGSTAIPMNSPRATPFASEGLVPIRVQDAAAYAALAVGGRFGVLAGNAVPVGTGSTVAACFGTPYGIMLIKSKARAGDGTHYILVEIQ